MKVRHEWKTGFGTFVAERDGNVISLTLDGQGVSPHDYGGTILTEFMRVVAETMGTRLLTTREGGEHAALLRLLDASLGPSGVAELHAVIYADKGVLRSLRNRLIGRVVADDELYGILSKPELTPEDQARALELLPTLEELRQDSTPVEDIEEAVGEPVPARVRIVRCSGDGYWYADRIGESFAVVRRNDVGDSDRGGTKRHIPRYEVRLEEPRTPGCRYTVDVRDCEAVDTWQTGRPWHDAPPEEPEP